MKPSLTLLAVLAFLAGGFPGAFADTPTVSAETKLSAKPVNPTIPKEQEIEIRRLIELTGVRQFLEQLAKQVLLSAKASGADKLPAAEWEKLQARMNPNEAVDRAIPVYAQYLSVEDLRAANAFYSTPAGQRLLQAVPHASYEAKIMGQRWGQQILMEVRIAVTQAAKTNSGAAPAK